MFLVGSADITDRIAAAPPYPEQMRDLILDDTEVLNILWETDFDTISESLPPGLHPSIPPAVNWVFLRAKSSPVGAFTLAQMRIECRTGTKPRAYLSRSFVDSPAARDLLRRHWAFDCEPGEVALHHTYPMVTGEVWDQTGKNILTVDMIDPDPFSGGVFLAPGLNLANKAGEGVLLEVSAKLHDNHIDRGRPRLRHFDAAAWGDSSVIPRTPVAGFTSRGGLTLPEVEVLYDPLVPLWIWPGMPGYTATEGIQRGAEMVRLSAL